MPATKGDLNRLDAKIDSVEVNLNKKIDSLKQETKKLSVEMAQTNVRVDRMENNIMSALREFKSDLLSAFEASVTKGKMYEDKAASHGDILVAHESKITDHEARITSLEQKP